MTLSINIRPGVANDLGLVFDSWLNGYADQTKEQPHGQYPLSRIPSKWYYDGQRRVISRIVDSGATLTVACNPEHHEQIYGWVCCLPNYCLHFVSVRKLWRGMKVASRLMEASFCDFKKEPIIYTHHTRFAERLRRRWKLVYNPYIVQER